MNLTYQIIPSEWAFAALMGSIKDIESDIDRL